jgi:hypothetical protein
MDWVKRRKRRFLPLVMSIVLLLTMLPAGNITALAEDSGFAGGDGSAGDPYQITTAEQLNAVRNDLSAHYILENDIDLTESVYGEVYGGEGWIPIGNYGNDFKGAFDGGGHTIRGLYINAPDEGNIGLFGSASGGVIKNLGLTGVDVTGSTFTGGLVGYAWGTTVENCFAVGVVKGSGDRLGILIGTTVLDTVRNCYAIGAVAGNSYVGGLVGLSASSIENCYAVGAVTGNSDTGGLVGYNSSDVAMPGTVTESYYNRQASGQSDTGKGTPKATADMMQAATYTDSGWDFTGVWAISEGASYPYLQAVVPDSLPAPPPLTGVTLSASDLTVPYGGAPVSLTATPVPPGALAAVTWESGNPAVATVDADGNVTPAGVGDAVITATTAPGGYTAQVTVHVRKYLTVTGSFTAEDKTYDGSTAAVIDGSGLSLSGVTDGDQVALNAVAAFADARPGQDKTVSLMSGSTLGGAHADQYFLDLTGAPTDTADINMPMTAGDGSEASPYQISDAASLYCVRFAPDAHYILTEDISLDTAPYNAGSGWEPIGDETPPFSGTFDGNGHTVSGLHINLPQGEDVGLFGFADDNSVIRAVTLEIGRAHV